MTVALDTGGADAAVPWIDRAKTTHPALIDAAHLLDELLGIVNVPTGIWIDEQGMIVRPPEPAFPWRPRALPDEVLAQLPADHRRAASRGREDADRPGGLRRRAARLGRARVAVSVCPRRRRGARAVAAPASQRSPARRRASSSASTCIARSPRATPCAGFARRTGWPPTTGPTSARPGRWPIRLQGPTSEYDSDWLTDVRKIGAENYYPALEL